MVRIQLDLSEGRVKELDALMNTTGVSTRKDLFNNALTLFEWAIKEKKQGHIIASIDEKAKKVKELVMPSLEGISADPEPAVAPPSSMSVGR